MSNLKAVGAGRVLLFYVASTALFVAVATLAPQRQPATFALILGAAGAAGTWALTELFCRWDGVTLESIGARLERGSVARLCAGFVLGSLLIGLHALALHVFGHATWVRNTPAQPEQIPLFLIAYALLAAREELVFHGYPLRRLAAFWSAAPALAIVTAVFIAEHVVGGASWASAIAGAGLGSLLFGSAALVSRGLALPIGIHAAWNFGDWMRGAGGKPPGGWWQTVIEPGFDERARIVGWAAYVLLLSATIGVLWWRARAPSDPPR